MDKRCLSWVVLAVLSAMLVTACAPPTSSTTDATPTVLTSATPRATPIPPPTQTPTPPSSHTPAPLGPWQPLPADGLPGPYVRDIAFVTPDVAFIVAGGNVYRSSDGGATWAESLNVYRMVQSVLVSPGYDADRTVFAVDGGSRLFRSLDGGETWEEVTRIDTQIGGASDVSVWLSISPAYPSDPTLWATASGQAYRSTDGGVTWAPFDPGVPLGWETRLVPNPDYPADPALEALDYEAAEWAPLPDGLPHPPTLLVASGETLLLGTWRGLWRSTDGGATWRESNAGLPPASADLLAVAPDGVAYTAVSLDARLFRLRAGGARWEVAGFLPVDDGWGARIVALDVVVGAGGTHVLAMATRQGLFVSSDGGASWERKEAAGLPSLDRPDLPRPHLSPAFAQDGLVHIVVEGRVYRTEDGGGSWTEVGGVSGVAQLVEAPDGRLLGLAPDAVYEWDPAQGPEWTRYPADFGRGVVNARFVTEQLVVATVDGGVFLSEEGGRSWEQVGQCEFGWPPYLISPRFDADGAIYAADGAGSYISTDAGQTWAEANAGLPFCEFAGPECGFELLRAEPADGGYTLYARVIQDFHSRIWVAHAQVN